MRRAPPLSSLFCHYYLHAVYKRAVTLPADNTQKATSADELSIQWSPHNTSIGGADLRKKKGWGEQKGVWEKKDGKKKTSRAPKWQTSRDGLLWIRGEFTTEAPSKHDFLHAWFCPSCCSFLSRCFLFCLVDNSNSSPCCIFESLPRLQLSPPPPNCLPQSPHHHLHHNHNQQANPITIPNPKPIFLSNTHTDACLHAHRHTTPREKSEGKDAANVFLLGLDKGLNTTVTLCLFVRWGNEKKKGGKAKKKVGEELSIRVEIFLSVV